MSREVRSVALAILIPCIYAGFIYFDYGTFVFPFPLNELIFLIVSIQFFFWNRKSYPALSRLFLAGSVLSLLSTELFWSFFLDTSGMEKLYNSPYLDLILITYYILLLIATISQFTYLDKKYKYVFLIICLIPLLAALYTGNRIYEVAFTAIIAIFTTIFRIAEPMNYLWILLAILNGMKIIMLIV